MSTAMASVRTVWLETHPLGAAQLRAAGAQRETWHLGEQVSAETLCGLTTAALTAVATPWSEVPQACPTCRWLGERSHNGAAGRT
jgi:hypothetical protein